jgi:ribosomal protein S18 acetylase RimI-like enzyme
MTTISVTRWNEANLEELAVLAIESRRSIGLTDANETIEDYIDKHRQSNERENFDWVITVHEKGELQGWATIWKMDVSTLRVSNWHPYIKDGRKEIALAIINKMVKLAGEQNQNAIYVAFSRVNDKCQSSFEKHYQWYAQFDFHEIHQEYFMTRALDDIETKAIEIPEGFDISSIDDWNYDDLCKVYIETFSKSNDRFFKLRTLENRRKRFLGILESEHMLKDASFVISERDEIAGFSLVTDHFPPAHLGPFGVLPKYRGMKLGRSLALLSMKSVAELGHRIVSLEVDTKNNPALNLYKNVGFEIESESHILHWKKK